MREIVLCWFRPIRIGLSRYVEKLEERFGNVTAKVIEGGFNKGRVKLAAAARADFSSCDAERDGRIVGAVCSIIIDG